MTAQHPPAFSPLVFISAAEPSADLHGASLIRATLAACPQARFVGVAGPRMVEAGCDCIFDMSKHAAMLLGAVRAIGKGISMMSACDERLRSHAFDAAVVIDSPTLHLPLAGRAQALGIPVMYYIAPQMWAWGAYRIHKLRNRCDRVAVILPFEEEYFRKKGVEATYVGHPLAEQLTETPIDDSAVRELRQQGQPYVALLPGSRTHVVESILPGQLDVARRISAAIPGAAFGVSVANPRVAPIIDAQVRRSNLRVHPVSTGRANLMRAADLVLVASGTSTLEVALHGRPMIVMYNGSRLFYHSVGRWLIHTPYLSLPNILAGREIVPEFMPYYTSTEPIARRAIELLRSDDARDQMTRDLELTVGPLRDTRASQHAAELLLDMVKKNQH